MQGSALAIQLMQGFMLRILIRRQPLPILTAHIIGQVPYNIAM